ncbi:MAG: hypothetical protein JETT_3145 [Candidatus Jettenia ecosi]|uniref:Uncharacterized protein n=1 Tax=Candidatus Jettenia ecosi TaxID=2494326 RepID=A0A533Q7H0_9BACT|nr:MAG: hypothetical protein JETT_3145 [Candidatus Jettenia ecosi]
MSWDEEKELLQEVQAKAEQGIIVIAKAIREHATKKGWGQKSPKTTPMSFFIDTDGEK